MNTILKIAGGVALGFLLVVVGDRTIEVCHRKISGKKKKFPGKKKKKKSKEQQWA